MNLKEPDKLFLENLTAVSKLKEEQVKDALTIADGFITAINLSTPFRKIKKMPSFEGLSRLKTLRLSEDTYAKAKKWLLKKLEIKSTSIENIEIWISRLTELTLTTPNALSLNFNSDKLTHLAVEKMANLTSLILAGYGQPFEKWMHEPAKLEHLKIDLTPDRVREGINFTPKELPELSNYVAIKHLHIGGQEVKAAINLVLENHQDLEKLRLYGGESVSVTGNPSGLLVYSVSEGTADTPTLHHLADAYNWDNGIFPLKSIIKSKLCSKDTAKMIYWRAKPTWFLQYESDEAVPEIEKETLKLVRLIERQFQSERVFVQTSFLWEEDKNPYPELPKVRSIPEYMS